MTKGHQTRAALTCGIFQPIIANDGIICGNWSPYLNDGKQNAGNKTQGCRATFFMGEHTADDVLVEWTRYKNT